jgi:hypothetical protein
MTEEEAAQESWLMFVHEDSVRALQDGFDASERRERSGMPFYPMPLFERLMAGAGY